MTFETKTMQPFSLDLVRNRICFRLVNPDYYKDKLSTLVNRAFQDLRIIYYIPTIEDKDNTLAILINHQMIHDWHITEHELHQIAMQNTPKMRKLMLNDIASTLAGMCGMGGEEVPEQSSFLYVCTTADCCFGASAMLYEDVLKNFSRMHGSFFILPSSVHEVLFAPYPEKEYVTMLEMVRQVNGTEVAPDDVLSNNVYFYDAYNHTIRMYK